MPLHVRKNYNNPPQQPARSEPYANQQQRPQQRPQQPSNPQMDIARMMMAGNNTPSKSIKMSSGMWVGIAAVLILLIIAIWFFMKKKGSASSYY